MNLNKYVQSNRRELVGTSEKIREEYSCKFKGTCKSSLLIESMYLETYASGCGYQKANRFPFERFRY